MNQLQMAECRSTADVQVADHRPAARSEGECLKAEDANFDMDIRSREREDVDRSTRERARSSGPC